MKKIVMSAKFLFFLGLISLFTACLESEYSIEVEESSDISFEDCPFYGFWADTLFCADTIIFYTPDNQLQLGSKLVINNVQYMDVHGWVNYRRTSFTFIIHDFKGVGKYSYPNSDSAEYYGDDFEFKIVDWDVASSSYGIENIEAGDYGEVVITQYNPNTGFIKGEARGLLSGHGGEKPIQLLRGGRFQGFYIP